MSATADIRNRAARRAADRARRRHYSHDRLMLWADIEEAKAREQGRDLPCVAMHPDEVEDTVFHGVLNAIGRRPPLVRFLACLSDARDALKAGDLHGAECALRMGCTMMPRDDEDMDGFEEAVGDGGLDALEFGLWAVQDGNAVRALGLIGDWLDRRGAA